jgi:hypothetical protein
MDKQSTVEDAEVATLSYLSYTSMVLTMLIRKNLLSKAAVKELNGDLDTAFQLYLKCASTFIHFARNAKDEKTRNSLKASGAKALERAERIKAAKRDLKPVTVDRFSHGEFCSSPLAEVLNSDVS